MGQGGAGAGVPGQSQGRGIRGAGGVAAGSGGQGEPGSTTAAPGQEPSARRRMRRPSGDALGTPDFSGAGADAGVGARARTRLRKGAGAQQQERQEQQSAGLTSGEGAIFGGSARSRDELEIGPDYTYNRMRLRKGEELNPYAATRDAQTAMDARLVRCIALGVVVAVSLLVAILLPSGWFSYNMRGTTMAQWMVELQRRVAGFFSLITFQGAGYGMDFVTFRYLIVAIAGAALGISGAVYQGSLKNALASPSTLGVMTGCNLGRILYVVFFLDTSVQLSSLTVSQIEEAFASMGTLGYLWAVYGMAICAIVCGFVVVAAVVIIATVAGRGRVSSIVMVIAGQVFATAIGAGVGLAQYYYTQTGDTATAQLLGQLQVETFANTFRALDVALVGIPVAIGIFIIMTQRTKLNLLAFSDEEARSMGLSTQRSRWIMVITCTALTGVIVAFCGQIGMVGFLVPHLVRRIVGPDFKYLVPASALAGAAFLVITYFATSLFEANMLSSFGVYTSLIGGIVFFIIALKQRGNTRGDWL